MRINKNLIITCITTAFVIFLCPFQTTAQTGPVVRILVMPQSTWTLNQDDADRGSYEYESTFGLAYGIGGAFRFTGKVGLGLDLIYSMEGQKYTVSIDSGAGKVTYHQQQKLNYFKIPLALTVNSNPEKRVMFAGRLGPQMSLLLSSKLEDQDGGIILEDTASDARWTSLLFGATLSTGIDIRLLESLLLNAGLRFDYTFGNSEDEDYPQYPENRAQTHNITGGFEIGLKYLIGE